MSEDVEQLKARILELEQRNADLKLQIPPSTTVVSGRIVVYIVAGLLITAFGTALTLWSMAKRTATERARAVAAKPAPKRVDSAARAVAHGIDACLEDRAVALPTTITLRVKLSPTGTLGLLDAKILPPDDAVGPCLRQIPSAAKVSPGDEGSGDVEVRYELSTEIVGERTTKITWAQKDIPPSFKY